ncbi:hypothetical protein HK099_007752, partial [Clydaea vesicula]
MEEKKVFALADGLTFMKFGAQAIAQDEFSKCFTSQKRKNIFKMRPSSAYFHLFDILFRYIILFPLRLTFLLTSTILFFSLLPIINYFKNENWQRELFKGYCNAFLISFGSKIKFNGKKPILDIPHIFVANHSSFIDYIVLSSHMSPHATVAQTHGGLFGFVQRSVLTLNGSLSFNRNEKKDRSAITRKMKAHVSNPKKSSLLIFPEGNCVNNEYTVLFHKGAFELDAAVVPVAIKYNKKYADAYWSTKTQTFTQHLMYLMTRWSLVAEVWYLPEQSLQPGESSAEFAGRVKKLISDAAGLKNLSWDGYLKNFVPPPEKQKKMLEGSQKGFGDLLQSRLKSKKPARSKSLNGDLKRNSKFSITSLERPSVVSNNNNDTSNSTLDLTSNSPNLLKSLDLRNRILVAVEEQDCRTEMIRCISNQKKNVVYTWRSYTKNRENDDVKRRIEYNSWRIWFKKRLEKENGTKITKKFNIDFPSYDFTKIKLQQNDENEKKVNKVKKIDKERNPFTDINGDNKDFKKKNEKNFNSLKIKKSGLENLPIETNDLKCFGKKSNTNYFLKNTKKIFNIGEEKKNLKLNKSRVRSKSCEVNSKSEYEDVLVYRLASYKDLNTLLQEKQIELEELEQDERGRQPQVVDFWMRSMV